MKSNFKILFFKILQKFSFRNIFLNIAPGSTAPRNSQAFSKAKSATANNKAGTKNVKGKNNTKTTVTTTDAKGKNHNRNQKAKMKKRMKKQNKNDKN